MTDTEKAASGDEEDIDVTPGAVNDDEPEDSDEKPEAEEGAAGEVGAEEGKETAPRPMTEADVDAALQTPRGQQIVLATLRQMASKAQSAAEAKETLDRAKRLIADEDYEGLGKEYVKLLSRHEEVVAEQEAERKAADQAVEFFYRKVLPTLAEQGDHQKVLQAMTKEERWDIHPDNPRFVGASDEQYIATYLDAIAQRRMGLNVEAEATKKFNEWKTAEANKQVGDTVRGGSVSTPPGKPGTATPNDARSLIRAGLSEEAIQPLAEEKEE